MTSRRTVLRSLVRMAAPWVGGRPRPRRPRPRRGRGVVGLGAAAPLEGEGGAALGTGPPRGGQLLQRPLRECLPAPAGIHAHDKQQIDQVHERLYLVERRRWVEREAG